MTRAKPPWLSDWLWHHYEMFSSRSFSSVPRCSEEWGDLIALCDTLVFSRECESVWKAIESRKNIPHETWLLRMRAARGEDFNPRPLDTTNNLLGDLVVLAFELFSIGPSVAETISKPLRKKSGAAIAEHARALVAALKVVDFADLGYPSEIETEIENHLQSVSKQAAATVTDHYEAMANSGKQAKPDKELVRERISATHLGVIWGINSLSETLEAVATGADQWAKSKPPVSQQSKANAGRLYFIRGLTRYFRKNYGTPLREQTAAIVRVVYKCDIDSATITTLSP